MRLFISIFVITIAILIAIAKPDTVLEYMRSFVNQKSLNTLSKTLHRTPILRNSSTMTQSKPFVGLPVIPPEDPSLNASAPKARAIRTVFEAREQSEGAGATVRRSIGTPRLRNFSPFLMLDHFTVPIGAGFPDHPHRGQETITYLLSGAVDHEDFAGHKGTINAGDLQFMTAGRGIVHAEMPHVGNDVDDAVPNVGMQLWVDLPKSLKACEPRYRDLRAEEIPLAKQDDGRVEVKVISGRSNGVDSVQELAYTPVWLLDVTIQPGGKLTQRLPAGWNAFAYVLEGNVAIETGAPGEGRTQLVPQYHNAVFEQSGDEVIALVRDDAKHAARFILVAGLPLDQPIVQYGPFVLTSADEVRQAFNDYSTHTNGFERAAGWSSEIGRVMG